ncbi:MAG TPA: NTP transferase domain-containing protein, partial [Gemmataceae bacterium]|nr:NTP transferase domain-containing protein [Gemmataceae bacterium]
MRAVAIVQARMNSTRLPGKALADLAGRPVLWHVVQRVRRAVRVDEVVVATSTSAADDSLHEFCVRDNIPVFRGSVNDLLDRYYLAARAHVADVIVRITGDCPLIDPSVIDRVLETYAGGEYDYVSNVIHYTYPDGLDVEALSMSALARAWREATKPSEREHVTTYLRFSNRFRTLNVAHEPDLSQLGSRWSIDEPCDLEFVRQIYAELADRPTFGMYDVLELLGRKPGLRACQEARSMNDGYYKSLYEQAAIDGSCRVPAPESFIDYTRPATGESTPSRELLGRRLQEGFNALAGFAGLADRYASYGEPVRTTIECLSLDGSTDRAGLSRFQTEAARRGIRVGDVHHVTDAHDVSAIEQTLQAYAGVFKTLAKFSGRPRATRTVVPRAAPWAATKRVGRGRVMLREALASLNPRLRELPLAERSARILRYYQLCRGPYEGEADHIRRRFEALHCIVGSDRLPLGSN